MNNSRSPVFGTSSVPSTSGAYFPPAAATIWKKAPVMCDKCGKCDNQSEPPGPSSLPASNSVQLHPVSDSSSQMSDFSTTAKQSLPKLFGAPSTVEPAFTAKDMKQENTVINPTSNPFNASIRSSEIRSPLATIVSSAMNTSTPVSSAKSVPSTPSVSRELGDLNTTAIPARSNFFGSSPSGTSFNHLKSSSVNIAAGNPTAQTFGSLFVNASHKSSSDIIDAPPQKRAKTAHNIADQLPANEFTDKLDLFRGPEVLVTAGTSLMVKSYRLPRALLLQASPYFETAIQVENIGQVSQEMLKMDCSTLAFDFVVQFLYTGTFVCPKFMAESGSEQITILVDFYELAEKLSLDISDRVLDNIKQLLVDDYRNLLAKHIRKAIDFPTGHGLRMLFARSCIHAHLESVNPFNEQTRTFVFKKELDELDGFAADLMRVYGEIADKRVPAKFAESSDLLDGETFYY
ncbi:hypothetical protein EAF04_005471 [Stromatinia cepivora]|nr:hypothetical protein EAF04_005471 [Stromatinia cepivora]